MPRLFDLVRVREEKIRLAFYFALRDTIVAEHLEQASRIGYGKDKRWGRVVTLKVRSLYVKKAHVTLPDKAMVNASPLAYILCVTAKSIGCKLLLACGTAHQLSRKLEG